MVEELKGMVGIDETILYEGKPDKKCFVFESIFNPLLPIAIIWGIFDFGFLRMGIESMQFIIIPFMLFHMMPVWIYLAGVIFSFKKYKNTYYHRFDGSCGIYFERNFIIIRIAKE